MPENNEITLDKRGIPTNTGGNQNGYSVEISDYVYEKIFEIDDDTFTEQEIEDYGLNVGGGKVDVSTTHKLINYLKSFVNKHMTNVQNDFDDVNVELARINTRIDNIKYDVLGRYYPIGAVYMSFESTDPSELFGGEWIKLENRFLLGSGSRNVGDIGGEEEHKLTINELASHTHTQNPHNHSQDNHSHTQYGTYRTATGNYSSFAGSPNSNNTVRRVTDGAKAKIKDTTATNKNTGGNQAHNNMPPYLVVHMWRRVL